MIKGWYYRFIYWLYSIIGTRTTVEDICKDIVTVEDALRELEEVENAYLATHLNTTPLAYISEARIRAVCIRLYEILNGKNIGTLMEQRDEVFVASFKKILENTYKEDIGFYNNSLVTEKSVYLDPLGEGTDFATLRLHFLLAMYLVEKIKGRD